MNVNFGRTSADYARHRHGFPDVFFAAVDELCEINMGCRLLDLGAGTGALCLPFAKRGARVTALDPASEQLEALRASANEMAVEVQTVVAAAEETGQADDTFNWITAGQCWHWFDAQRVMREVLRLLAPDGRLLIASFDWLPLPGSVVAATESLILEHNPSWSMAGGNGLHPEWRKDVTSGGLQVLEERSGEHQAVYSHEAWRGRIRASAGVSASLAPDAVRAFDEAHQALLNERFAQDPMHVPHRWSLLLAGADPSGTQS